MMQYTCNKCNWISSPGQVIKIGGYRTLECPVCAAELILKEFTKPPIGLKPKHIHDQLRALELLDAMRRYIDNNKYMPEEWFIELEELNRQGFKE